MCLISHIKNKIVSIRNKNWDNKLKIAKTKNNSLWRILRLVQEQRKRVPSLLFILSDQSIIFYSKAKADALAECFHSVYLQVTNLTSPHLSMVNDYVAQLDA